MINHLGKVFWFTHEFASLKMKQQNTNYLRGLSKSKFGQNPETTLCIKLFFLIFCFRTTIICSQETHFSDLVCEFALNVLASSERVEQDIK